MLLAERIVLLLIDPQRGELRAPKRTAELDVLCAAALLTELVAQLRVQAQGGRLVAAGGLPASHPLLDRAHVCLGRHAMPASQAIAAVLHGSDSLPQRCKFGFGGIRRRCCRYFGVSHGSSGSSRRAAVACVVDRRGWPGVRSGRRCGQRWILAA
jgi:hypothetical protein